MEMPSWKAKELTPGQLSERSGVAVSALHFYEREGSSSVAGPAETSADTNETRFDASPSSESRNASAFRCRKSERPSAHFLKAVPRTAQIGKDCRPGGGATSIYASSNWNVYGTTSPVASVAGASRWRGAPSPTRTINSHPPAGCARSGSRFRCRLRREMTQRRPDRAPASPRRSSSATSRSGRR